MVKLTKEQKAGLQFNINKVKKNFDFHLAQQNVQNKTTESSMVYLAAVLEYFTAEIYELSGNTCNDYKKLTIKKKFIDEAIKNDEELRILFAVTKKKFPLENPPNSLQSYTYKVLKKVHPNNLSSKETKEYVDQLLNSLLKIIAYNTRLLLENKNKNKNIDEKIIQNATRLSISNELLKYSVSKGIKAFTKFTN